ncbi:hypothetical protein ACFLXA_03540 [Chloroflexota bacterium]
MPQGLAGDLELSIMKENNPSKDMPEKVKSHPSQARVADDLIEIMGQLIVIYRISVVIGEYDVVESECNPLQIPYV